ncbi:MAG: HD-GYP domain-containing protein, partial [Chloroflexota bacterium]
MRRVPIQYLAPGQILARPLYNERGDILLNSGVELTERFIRLLGGHGVASVFVRQPGDQEDVEPEDIVTERVRVAALANVRKVFEVAAKATAGLRGRSAQQVLDALQQPGNHPSQAEAADYEQLFRSVESIVDEVLNAYALPGLSTLKSYDNYTFCHSVDVAVTALLLGKKLHLPRERLKALGVGCILHDVGKSAVPQHVLNKPGKLTDDEYALVKKHPTVGYELLRAQLPDQVLPKHIALQHHERQDGGGYPRALRGANKVAREIQDRFETGRMMLLAEIAAVADVYDALASDRPYRAGMPAEQIADIMQDMRGRHLNAEVLDIFLSVFPRYPVGLDMVATGGPYAGFRGIVLASNRRAADRPMVRLVYDRRGARLSPPLEIDLTREPDTTIT